MTTNGHDKDEKIVSFPDKAQRKRDEKRKAEQEKKWREQYKADQKKANAPPPFINFEKITPFAGSLVVAFVIIHLAMYIFLDDGQTLKAIFTLGFVPGAFTGAYDFNWYTPLSALTHMFIHGGWMHLIFNTVMTLMLGIFVERELGTRRTAIFFFLCGIAGALTYFIFAPTSTVPLIGASGGTSGLFGAVLLLIHERQSGHQGAQMGNVRIQMRAPSGNNFKDKFLKNGPWPMVAFWLVLMIVMGLIGGPGIAWQAHIGGFLAGIALLRGLQRKIIKF